MSQIEEDCALALQWLTALMSIGLFIWYGWQVYKKQCGWEVIYICILESFKYAFEIAAESQTPFTIYLTRWDGKDVTIAWIRYAEWLTTCPVILIALSNLTGLKDDYNWRTMKLLASDQGTIICGVTAAMGHGWVKVVFFGVGFVYGLTTWYTACAVYIESYQNVPNVAKPTVRYMAIMFFVSWAMFPLLFLMGPEGFGHISNAGSTIGHTFADLLSKNLWGIYAWFVDGKLVDTRTGMDVDDKFIYGDASNAPNGHSGMMSMGMKSPSMGMGDMGMNGGMNGMNGGMNGMNGGMNGMNGGMLAMNGMNGGMNGMMSMGAAKQEIILIADHNYFSAGGILANKLQSEMGKKVLKAMSKEELISVLQSSTVSGQPPSLIMVCDGLLSQMEANMLIQNFKAPIVQFGNGLVPEISIGAEYIQNVCSTL
eukprot:gene16962-20153_t